jgi:ketosteroid isomerase-like protein
MKERKMTIESKATDEAQLRKLIDDRVKAIRARDVNGAISNVAPDVLLFDVINPLQYVGSDESRKRAEEWFSSFQGPIGYELRDLSIATGDEVAFSHSLNRVNATRTDGQKLDMWWRATVCYRKIDGKWTVTHEHNSVPFDVESGKASLDLKP